MHNKLVSIVLPTYNGSKYLSESICSILLQTYKNWELIIIDDCSTDDTANIAQFYVDQDKRISLLHNDKNMKLPYSLNKGFRAAKGELLTWTSDDNMYFPDALETMANELKPDNVFMVCADVQSINDKGNVIGQLIPYDENTMLVRDTVGACFMYKRIVYETIGDYDCNLFCVEDYDYWIRILKRFGHIKRIPKTLYKYRFHKAALTATKSDRVIEMRTKIYDKYLDDILRDYKDRKQWLVQAYYDYVIADRADVQIKHKFCLVVPELIYELTDFSKDYTYIIFGSGNFGHKTFERIGGKTVCFADNSKTKQGTTIKGIPVYSVEEAVSKYPKSRIIISIGGEHTYGAIRQIINLGKNECMTYQSLIHKKFI